MNASQRRLMPLTAAYCSGVAAYKGRCVVKSVTGQIMLEHAVVTVDDDDDPHKYPSRPPWSGHLTSDGADLMREPFRSDPHYVLECDTGEIMHVRINSWDQGGQRAQIVGDGAWPFG
jgi:hypothetical protein